jgi:vitamin B12 transporter
VPAIAQRFGFYGNPDLLPERSRGWDVGWQEPLLDGELTLDATYFRNDFQDLIVFDTSLGGPTGFGALNNVGRARTSGVELVASLLLTDATDMTVNYTHLDTMNELTQTRLLRRPDNRVGFGIHHRFQDERTRLNLDFQYVGTRLDYDDQFSVTSLENYILVNLSSTYQWSSQCELSARIENLFDERYEEVFGFGTPGIGGFVGLQLRQ